MMVVDDAPQVAQQTSMTRDATMHQYTTSQAIESTNAEVDWSMYPGLMRRFMNVA
jgi:hypothetical protein